MTGQKEKTRKENSNIIIWTQHTQILSLQHQHPTDRLTGLTAGPRFVGFERRRRRRKEK
jgi:hypothetical protein